MSIPKPSSYTLPIEKDLPVNRVDWPVDHEHTALLIHDMQNYFINFWESDDELISQVILNISILKNQCKMLGIPIFYTVQSKKQSNKERGLLTDMWGLGLQSYPEQCEITKLLSPDPDDTVISTCRYSAFLHSDFEELLKSQQCEQLIICGIYGHIGCLITANDAFMRDIKPFIVSDAIADFSYDEHIMTLKYIASSCGKIVTTTNLLEELRANKIWTLGLLRSWLNPFLDDDEQIDENDNLFDYGLDSISLMSLLTQWRKHNPKLHFVSFIQKPTLANWLNLLNK